MKSAAVWNEILMYMMLIPVWKFQFLNGITHDQMLLTVINHNEANALSINARETLT